MNGPLKDHGETGRRWASLCERLQDLGRAAVAFSGGVDSTMLLAACASLPRLETVAVTAESEFMGAGEVRRAAEIAAGLRVRHVVVRIEPLSVNEIASNPRDRCYHCKSMTFRACLQKVGQLGFDVLMDGRIADDDLDFRPGTRAARELGVLSPLADAGFTKADVRGVSRTVLDLDGWDRPSGACLASRFPTGTPITADSLSMVDSVEGVLKALGFRLVRARFLGETVRIETSPEEFGHFCDPAIREEILRAARAAGFKAASLDLEPYRCGRMNEGA